MEVDRVVLLAGVGRVVRDGAGGVREVGVGEVDVLEGVVLLDEEVHIDVGVVVEGLVALDACVRAEVQ